MLAVYKAPEITSTTFPEARKIVVAGLQSLTGAFPETKVMALVLAKITLEAGRKGEQLFTSCYDGNVGNIKCGIDTPGMFTLYPCNEVLSGEVKWFSPEGRLDKRGGVVVGERYAVPPDGDGHPQCRFRAYANIVDGIYEYLDFIWREKYRDARDALLTGSPINYVHQLKLKGYFTADETVYARAVNSLHAEFLAKLTGRPAPAMPVPDLQGQVRSQPYNVTTVTALVNASLAEIPYDMWAENHDPKNFIDDDEEVTEFLPKGPGRA